MSRDPCWNVTCIHETSPRHNLETSLSAFTYFLEGIQKEDGFEVCCVFHKKQTQEAWGILLVLTLFMTPRTQVRGWKAGGDIAWV